MTAKAKRKRGSISTHSVRFPGESAGYRTARTRLLKAEMDLRRNLEKVAAMRRRLPLGGPVPEDYMFEEGAANLDDTESVRHVRLTELFRGAKRSLVVYSFMYAPGAEHPCPMCTSILDGLNGSAPHVQDRVNLAVVAKAPIQRIRGWASKRGWNNLRLLSSRNNTYNVDYHAETADGAQWPAINVFRKTADGIFHFYNAELFYVPTDPGQHPRHADLIWPLWNLFDLTPDGRGTNWFPKFSYR